MRTGREPATDVDRLRAEILACTVAVIALLSMTAHASSRESSARSFVPKVAGSFIQPTIYAADCTTPQTTFNLGDTVCVKGSALIGLRFQWVNAEGFSVKTSDINSDPQTATFILPTTDQSNVGGLFIANNLGRWRINAVNLGNRVRTSSFFTVRDPANPMVDLGIVKTFVGSEPPGPGDPVEYILTVTNQGPNDAVNTHWVDNMFTNATFNSLVQTSGPAFTCNGADCTIASLPNGATATFVLNFTAGAAGSDLENSATISSDTPELNPRDNSASAAPITVASASSGPPPTCNLMVTAPAPVTLYTSPGATACGVTISDLDATLGTATATASCSFGPILRSGVPVGNFFPVGTTTLTYATIDALFEEASANQSVMVVDNTPPVIACPQNITLDPTCPNGAVASWTAPVAMDNCSATAAQTAGPGSGSVFPIGTTTVTYTATDPAGNQTSCSFTVTVLTVTAAIQKLEPSLNASTLNGPQKQGLLSKLDAALASIGRGQGTPACNQLNAFVNEVQALMGQNIVPVVQGQAWINTANHVINTIGCTSNPCV